MRNFEIPGRSVAAGANGMIATSNPQAALVGLDILRQGGNAVDAAVAVAAMLAVVEPTQTGIGGDCFVLMKKKGQAPIALNGAGWSARAADATDLRARGLTDISSDSIHSVIVPGAVSAWERLLEDHGTMPFGEIFVPAIDAAEQGYIVTERLARDWALNAHKVSKSQAASNIYLPGGRAPEFGDKRHNLPLGKALRSIASEGAKVFYTGWIADDILSELQGLGSALTHDDFSTFKAEYVTPISTTYRGYQLWECPPNGQGLIALQMAAMLDRFDVATFGPLSAERFHLQGEISRLAYTQRDALVCDPKFVAVDVERLLSKGYIDELAGRFSMQSRIVNLAPAALPYHKDTVFISVVDASGTAVSFINSLFEDFGSGIAAPRSGVLLHNRGSGFSLAAGHPNELQPRKRPMHTIIPALLTKDGETVMSFGCTGGHFQAAGQMQVLSNIIDYGMSVQLAIDHPRMFARGDTFELESTVPKEVWSGLERRGHQVTATVNPLGTCHAIWVDRDRGLLMGGSDGRRDGLAIGY